MRSPKWDEDLLAQHRAIFADSELRSIFDTLVGTAISSTSYDALPFASLQGRGLFFSDPTTHERFFAVLLNESTVEFRVGRTGRRQIAGGFVRLQRAFPLAKINPRREWSVQIDSNERATILCQLLDKPSLEHGNKASRPQNWDKCDTYRAFFVTLVPNDATRTSVLQQIVSSFDEADLISPRATSVTISNTRIQLQIGDEEVFSVSPDVVVVGILCPLGEGPALGDCYVEAAFECIDEPASAFIGSHENFTSRQSSIQEAHLGLVSRAALHAIGSTPNPSRDFEEEVDAVLQYARNEIAKVPRDSPSSPHPVSRQLESLRATDSDLSANQLAIIPKYPRTNVSPTMKQSLIDARLGQGVFRKRVIELECRCRVSGVEWIDHLRASHIKP